MKRFWIASALCLLSFGGCPSIGTALLLEIDGSAVLGVEQFHVVGRQGEQLIFGPTIRPESANGPLEGKQTLRVLLADDVVGAQIAVFVDGLIAGQSAAFGEASADPVRDREIRVPIALAGSEPRCTGCTGCCTEGQCLAPSVAACGAGGVGCFPCDPVLADACTNNGRCVCGTGPQCQRIFGADRCANGECVCGESPNACPAGLACTNGICQCTDKSCPGCCDGANRCQVGSASTACGTGGTTCSVCGVGFTCSNYRCMPG